MKMQKKREKQEKLRNQLRSNKTVVDSFAVGSQHLQRPEGWSDG